MASMALIPEFLDGLHPNTRRAYKGDLEAFRIFVGAATAEDAVRG
jgi:hypothetical protein